MTQNFDFFFHVITAIYFFNKCLKVDYFGFFVEVSTPGPVRTGGDVYEVRLGLISY